MRTIICPECDRKAELETDDTVKTHDVSDSGLEVCLASGKSICELNISVKDIRTTYKRVPGLNAEFNP